MKFLIVLLWLAVTPAFSQTRSTPAESAEAAVRQADAEWAVAIASKSVEKTAAMYDREAFTAGTAMPPARGAAAVRAMWTELFAQPGFSLTWKLEQVVVNESGSMATSSGKWLMPRGGGPYLAVWRKQSDGKWKVLIDSAWYSSQTD